ncbi:MAG TPA: NAD-dependent epimerase/dehydratase family protein [Acidimicrobiia bacterium]
MQTMRVAVVGATGTVGRHVVELLEKAGHEVVPISRAHGVDVITTAGLETALGAVECIIDAANPPSPNQEDATEFFRTSARNLHAVGSTAGVSSIVVVSIVGIDRFTAGYYMAKREHEKAMLQGPIPIRILRSTQFHELVGRMVDRGRQGGVAHVPKMRIQPIAARTAAEAIATLVTRPKASSLQTTHDEAIHEIAGPRQESLAALARLLVAHRGDPVRVEEESHTDPDADSYESGALLPGPNTTLAGPTFEEWLESQSDIVSSTVETDEAAGR